MRVLKMLVSLLVWPLAFIINRMKPWFRSFGGDAGKRRKRAQQIATAMQDEFGRLGFTKTITMKGKKGKTKRQRVQFDYPLLMTQDELWLPIKHTSLPTGVRPDDLREEGVVRSLEDRLNVGVRIDCLPTSTLCFVVRLGGSTFPAKFSLNAFETPEEASPLAFPLGVNSYGGQVVGDLIDFKHLLVAGATGGGKTTLYHSIITTLISRNSPDTLELWLIDMKRTEFALYRPLMGKRDKPGIVRHIAVDPPDAVDLLARAYKEIVTRNQHMEKMGVTSITDLEQSTGQRLKRIVLLVDEFAILTTDTTKVGKQSVGKWSKLLMTRIASLGRSAGVSICIATQMVKKEVIDGMISANFENRIAFSCATWRESNLVVQSSEAVGLPDGRAIVRIDGKTTEVQTCYVTPGQVKLEIARVAEFGPDGGLGNEDTRRFVKNAKLLLDVACRQLGGDFTRSKLLSIEGIRGTISWDMFDEISKRLERDGVLEPGGPRKPRRVSRAFFGRPNLIDQFYGVIEAEEGPLPTPTVIVVESIRSDDTMLRGSRQDAEKPTMLIEQVTGYGATESPAYANIDISDDDDPDEDDLMEIGQLFAAMEPEPEPDADSEPKAKKAKKPKKKPGTQYQMI